MPPYTGKVLIDGKTWTWKTTFSDTLKFRCAGCGICCIASNVYLEDDEKEAIEKIGETDFSSRVKDPQSGKEDQLLEKQADKRCHFLDDRLRCRVYTIRPLICRMFPFKAVIGRTGQIDIDVSYGCSAVIDR